MLKNFLLLLLIPNLLWSQWSITDAERDILVNIYNATDGENWNRTWDFEKDPKTWFGVLVKNGVVAELNLSNNALKGNFPTFVSSLHNLTKLDFSNNQLSGEVPDGVFSSLNLLTKLDISNNYLSGDPTNALTGLSNLNDLGLGGNMFTIVNVNTILQNFNDIKFLNIADLGLTNIPPKISSFPNLETLILDNNPIEINTYGTLSGLSHLSELSLSGTQLAQIPSQIASLPLIKLNLSNNNFTEQNAAGLSSFATLKWLSLESNQLTQIPPQIAQLEALQTLNLGRNQISGNFSTITNLPNLQQLFLNNNQLSGNFPSELLGLPNLLMLNLNSNQLSGDVPSVLPPITFVSNNRFTESQLVNYITDYEEQTELDYSPQRYDNAKTVVAQIGESATLDQSLSGNYAFSWFKNLDENLNSNGEDLNFSSVQDSDYAVYTVEAYTYSQLPQSILFELSLFREPITLTNQMGTSETKNYFSIYPNPTSDYLYIINSKSDIEKVYIYDLSGKQMLSDSKSKIYVGRLPSGVYMLNIKTKDGFKNFRFIKF